MHAFQLSVHVSIFLSIICFRVLCKKLIISFLCKHSFEAQQIPRDTFLVALFYIYRPVEFYCFPMTFSKYQIQWDAKKVKNVLSLKSISQFDSRKCF